MRGTEPASCDHSRARPPAGAVSQALLDTAFIRVWSHAIRLGYFDDPSLNPYAGLGPADVDTPEHRALALSAAQQGIVLLKNEGNLLPLGKQSVAVIGPHGNATQDMLSIYVGTNTLVNSHSPLQAITARGVSVAGYAPGCDIMVGCNSSAGIAAAAALAKTADVAIVFVGLHPGQGGGDAREDEGWDRTCGAAAPAEVVTRSCVCGGGVQEPDVAGLPGGTDPGGVRREPKHGGGLDQRRPARDRVDAGARASDC